MSVINKMLRDLEQRQHTTQIQGTYQPSKSASGFPRSMWFVLFIGALLVAAIIGTRWFQPVDSTPQLAQPQSVKIPHEDKAVVEAAATKAVAPASGTHTVNASVAQQQADGQPSLGVQYAKIDQQQAAPSDRNDQTSAQEQRARPVQAQPQAGVAIFRAADVPADVPVDDTADAPTNPLAALQEQVASALMMENQTRAIALLEDYLRAHATAAWPVLALAELLDRSSQFAAVDALYRQWLSSSTAPKLPTEVAIELRLAFADWLLRRRQFERAKTTLVEVPVDLKKYQLSEETLSKAIRLFKAMNVKQRECMAREHWLSYQPSSARRQLGLAVCLEQAGEVSQAVKHYQGLNVGQLPPEGQDFVRQRLEALSRIGLSAGGLAEQPQSEQPTSGREQ